MEQEQNVFIEITCRNDEGKIFHQLVNTSDIHRVVEYILGGVSTGVIELRLEQKKGLKKERELIFTEETYQELYVKLMSKGKFW